MLCSEGSSTLHIRTQINLQSMLALLLPPFSKQTIENLKYISLSNKMQSNKPIFYQFY